MPLNPIAVVEEVLKEYRSYLATEFQASDVRLREALEKALDDPQFLAQEPFFQAHRPFKDGRLWRDLGLDPRLASVMEKRSGSATGWLHQSEAIAHLLGPQAGPLVVTTGTGSGKTECFLLPVIQNAIEDSTQFNRSGLTALLVYPMNALANDQEERIREYLSESGHTHVTVARYDRSTKEEERRQLRDRPPHILLTNYMMLEYLLVRPADRNAIFANHRCRFVVLDEVHSYRGSLGANIALLFRRLVAHLQNARQDWNNQFELGSRRFPKLIPVGTSATIKSVDEAGRSAAERRQLRDEAVQEFLGRLTGFAASTFRVLGEELKDLHVPAGLPFQERLIYTLNDLLSHKPMSVSQLVQALKARESDLGLIPEGELLATVWQALKIGVERPDGEGALRLRVHRFIRGGWRFTRCLNPECGALHPMGEEKCSECGYPAAALLLCRSCGAHALRLRACTEAEPPEMLTVQGGPLPEWLVYDRTDALEGDDGIVGAEKQMRQRPVCKGSLDPATLLFSSDETAYGMKVVLAPEAIRCLVCGGTAGSRDVLTEVSLGTSAAVRVLSEGLVQNLAEQNKDKKSHDGKERLLIFADSRQDAAHQARFITYAARYDRMRRRIVSALEAEPDKTLSLQKAVERLMAQGLSLADNPRVQKRVDIRYASQQLKAEVSVWEEAPLLDDLAVSPGYRATLFNLGLVGVVYDRLEEYLADRGANLAHTLGLTNGQLVYLSRCLLDEMRRRGALAREMLRYHPGSSSCPQEINYAADWERKIKSPAGYSCDEQGNPLPYLDSSELPEGLTCRNIWRKERAGGRGPGLERTFRHLLDRMGGSDASEEGLLSLLALLMKDEGFVVAADLVGTRKGRKLLQVNDKKVLLKLLLPEERFCCTICNVRIPFVAIGSPCPKCRGEMHYWDPAEIERNRYVARIRQSRVSELNAGEHTAQVTGDARMVLEEEFKAPSPLFQAPSDWRGTERRSALNVLACSPTLEMGIDVGGLDAVVMRNVPPRPDNYAQRGGRAGRRSRIGVVVGYARSTPHDAYFFDRPEEMIAGEVAAPAVGLGNRDVVLRHLHALVFGAAEPGLAGRMVHYIETNGALKGEKVEELIVSLMDQFGPAAELALQAWEPAILEAAGLGDKTAILGALSELPKAVEDLFDRVSRQIRELQHVFERWNELPSTGRQSISAQELKLRLLGVRSGKSGDGEADDRGSGHPMRRFAEFGILPGYEFPSEPSTLRLVKDGHEEEPVSVARRFGLSQYQPSAVVHARGHRWRVRGLDISSPWNPKSDEPGWKYARCKQCELRYDHAKPQCPRCQSDEATGGGAAYPGFEFGGFLAFRDDRPVLEEEDRFGAGANVTCHPQRNGRLLKRYRLATDWTMTLCAEEEVRWVNEGPRQGAGPTKEIAAPSLHSGARGFYLCPKCGNALHVSEEDVPGGKGRKKARKGSAADPFGHAPGCADQGKRPFPLALAARSSTTTLRIQVVLPDEFGPDEYLRWGYSLGYSLRIGMRQVYMLDGNEIEFELEPMWTQSDKGGQSVRYGALTFIDAAIGGSGFLDRAAEQFHLVARQAAKHLDHPRCESACYRCLKSYTNQRHHHLLSWPHIMGDLESLATSPPVGLHRGVMELDDPRPWLDAYEAGVGSPLELKFLRLFEKHGIPVLKQVCVEANQGEAPISQADFQVANTKTLVYVDGAAFHKGRRIPRDARIRERLAGGNMGWKVVVLRAKDLADEEAVIGQLQ